MARYGRDYGREFSDDFGRREGRGYFQGGMRPDAWDGWGGFGPEEGWGSQRQQGFFGGSYDQGYRGESGYGNFQGGHGGYGADYGGRGFGYGGRNAGYSEGWQDQRGGMGQGMGRQDSGNWGRARAAEIMTENPHAVTPDVPISEVAQKMRDLDVGIIPVIDSTENRRLRGVITDRDITVRAVAEGKDGNSKVSDCMTDRVRAVNKNDSIQDVMWVMRRDQVRRVPVTDREGRLVGIIAQADLAVDYASDDRGRESQVAETLERVSEPARPHGAGNRMSASGMGDRQEFQRGRDGSAGPGSAENG